MKTDCINVSLQINLQYSGMIHNLFLCAFDTFESLIFFFDSREYLETVCMHLYDMLRPLVIHMKHFETLVELCTILRIEILQDYVSEDGN